MPLYVFYTMVQKSQKCQKLKSRGSCLKKRPKSDFRQKSNFLPYRRVSRNALPVVTRDAICNWMATQAASLAEWSSFLKLRLCSPISFGFSPCECVKRNPCLPPSSRCELKWVKILDLRALCRQNLVFSIDGDHVHLHGSASISYFKIFVCRWFSDHLSGRSGKEWCLSLKLASNSCFEPSGSQLPEQR